MNLSDSSSAAAAFRLRLFDAYGLPWTSSLEWYWLYLLTALTGLGFAFALGIYLGLWLISKGRGTGALTLYLATTVVVVALCFIPAHAGTAEYVGAAVAVILWFTAAYVLRRDVIRYYTSREGTPFRINPALAALFPVWYINGRLRADFPLDASGKAAGGTLKLSISPGHATPPR
jgi:hypothetical protein